MILFSFCGVGLGDVFVWFCFMGMGYEEKIMPKEFT